MGKITITEGDAQPLDCPKCVEKHGYQTSEHLKTHYSTVRKPDGSFDQGFYSDYQPRINRPRHAHCPNCGHRLPFWVEESKNGKL